MKSNSLVLALTLGASALVCAAAEPTDATVKAALRARLLGNDTLVCHREFERCIVPIYVLPDVVIEGVRFDCGVFIPISEITVERHPMKKLKVVWVLNKGDLQDKTSRYRFKPLGIQFKATTPITADDFDQAGHDADDDEGDPGLNKRRYKLRSVNQGPAGTDKMFEYLPVVERRKTAGAQFVPCQAADPRIINQG